MLRLRPDVLLPLTPPNLAAWTQLISMKRRDPSLVYGQRGLNADATYYSIRESNPPAVRYLYEYRMATSSGNLRDFHIIASLDNRMKKTEDMDGIIARLLEFGKANYLNTNAAFLVGDFYVWRNALHSLWRPGADVNRKSL